MPSPEEITALAVNQEVHSPACGNKPFFIPVVSAGTGRDSSRAVPRKIRCVILSCPTCGGRCDPGGRVLFFRAREPIPQGSGQYRYPCTSRQSVPAFLPAPHLP